MNIEMSEMVMGMMFVTLSLISVLMPLIALTL